MSTSTPRPRRRIAGERKTIPRPADSPTSHEETGPESAGTVTPPASSASDRVRTRSEEATPERAPARPRRPAPPRLLTVLAAAATVLVLVATLLALLVDGAGWDDWKMAQRQDDIDSAVRTAPAAAERAAATILAYDYEDIEADRDAAAALMTPEYREEYLETFDKLVSEKAVEQKAKLEADVRASGVATPGEDRVEVLLFVNQTTVSTANNGEPQVALNRVVLTMERDGDTWRVDGITSY